MADIDPPGGQFGVEFGSGGGQNDPPRGPNWTLDGKTLPHGQNDPPGGQNWPLPGGRFDPQGVKMTSKMTSFWHPTVKNGHFGGGF